MRKGNSTLGKRIKARTLEEAELIIRTKGTVRGIAELTGVPKSTVHIDLTQRLPDYSLELYEQVRNILEFNWQEHNYRGGVGRGKQISQLAKK